MTVMSPSPSSLANAPVPSGMSHDFTVASFVLMQTIHLVAPPSTVSDLFGMRQGRTTQKAAMDAHEIASASGPSTLVRVSKASASRVVRRRSMSPYNDGREAGSW